LTWCDRINPENIKRDSEKVLDFVVKEIKVRGKVGVYGRSLGGIASTHLANKFPEIISALIVDRTFGELDVSSERRLFGSYTRFLYKFISVNWKTRNDANFIAAENSFKIITSDPLDEVVDNFSSLPAGVAEKLALYAYSEDKWKDFFNCLKSVYEFESLLFNSLGIKDAEAAFKPPA
jgi:pimeloyl-ACP methyl ester carboxylesterase